MTNAAGPSRLNFSAVAVHQVGDDVAGETVKLGYKKYGPPAVAFFQRGAKLGPRVASSLTAMAALLTVGYFARRCAAME